MLDVIELVTYLSCHCFLSPTSSIVVLRYTDMQLQLTDAKGRILDLEDQNDQLSRTVTSLEAENAGLTNNLDKLHQHISSKEDELDESTQALQKLQKVESNQNDSILEMKEKLRKYAAEEDRLKQEFSKTHQELQEMQCNHKSLIAENRELMDKYSNVLATLHDQEDANRITASELNKVKDELKVTQQQLTRSKQSEEDAVALVKKSKEEATRMMEQMTAKLDKSCSDIRSELEHTHKIELDTLNCDKKHLVEENSRLMVKFEVCSNELNAAKKVNNTVTSKLQQSLADLTEERQQCELIQGQLHEVSAIWCSLLRKQSQITQYSHLSHYQYYTVHSSQGAAA